jgi:metallo-beta-lactamase class B
MLMRSHNSFDTDFQSRIIKLIQGISLLSFLISGIASAQLTMDRIDPSNRPDNDNHRRDPVHLIDNIWWVGHSQVGSFLIKTTDGLILFDSTSTIEVNWMVENIVKAGFHLSDIKYIINSHPHEEHIGGLAALQRLLPEAKIITSRATADILATGGKSDFRNILDAEGARFFEPVKVDGFIGHQEELTLGGVTLTAHLTPGHTTGTTTWSIKVNDNGNTYDAVLMGGVSSSGLDRGPLLNNELYSDIKRDFDASFAYLKSMNCDIYFEARAISFKMEEKLAKIERGGNQVSPFVDPKECENYIEFYELRYKKQLADEMAAEGR